MLSFAIYQLRTAYLTNIKDGIGERLISVNTSILNNPAFRAAGWQSNTNELKSTYSPPIPTAITSDYFQAPPRAVVSGPLDNIDDNNSGGLATVARAGNETTLGPSLNTKRRRRNEADEEDSSDLSDESEDEVEGYDIIGTQISMSRLK